VVDWPTILVTAGTSTALTYAITSARITREETAKLRAAARHELPELVGELLAEAEGIRRQLVVFQVTGDRSPLEQVYESYKECSGMLTKMRQLNWWERYLVQTFCDECFGVEVRRMAMRLPEQLRRAHPAFDFGSYALVEGETVMEAKFSHADLVQSMFRHDTRSMKLRLNVGTITQMRMNKIDAGVHTTVAGEETTAAEVSEREAIRHAERVVKLCERMQYPRFWHVAAVRVETILPSVWRRVRRAYSLRDAPAAR
jgi:hypothetical protein